MSLGRVLVIEDDEATASVLAAALQRAGFAVSLCGTVQSGIATAFALRPICVLCDLSLPDGEGYAVVRHVRAHPSRVSAAPILMLSTAGDPAARAEAFQAGVDVYLTKPFEAQNVVGQVGALVRMAARLSERRDSALPAAAVDAAFEGDLGQMSVATVLTLLELDRRSGVVEAMSGEQRAKLELSAGRPLAGAIGDDEVGAVTAMRAMLGWTTGRFSFTPTPMVEAGEPDSERPSVTAMLLEATRLDDEALRRIARRSEPSLTGLDEAFAPASDIVSIDEDSVPWGAPMSDEPPVGVGDWTEEDWRTPRLAPPPPTGFGPAASLSGPDTLRASVPPPEPSSRRR